MTLLKHWNSKLRIHLFTLLTFLAGVGFTLLIHNYESENRKSLDREHAEHVAEEIATDFEREITNIWAFHRPFLPMWQQHLRSLKNNFRAFQVPWLKLHLSFAA